MYKLNRAPYRLHLAPSDDPSTVKACQQPALTAKGQQKFLSLCWGLKPVSSELQSYESYIRHYQECCEGMHELLRDCTHGHLAEASQKLCAGTRRLCEDAVKPLLPSTCRSPEAVTECVNFIGRAILMIDLSRWENDESLPTFVIRTVASHSSQKDQYRIPLSFNARTFDRVAGIKLLWTRNLLSHLEIGLEGSSLEIFHNVAVLQLFEQSNLGMIFPDGFLDETRRTLSLMFPVADSASMKWFKQEQKRLGLDEAAGKGQHLRAAQRSIQNFDFWRDRLIIGKEAFELSQPTNLVQFWRDDRNRIQWWTFWIAITVFLFTVIGVVESALQVYKAYYPS